MFEDSLSSTIEGCKTTISIKHYFVRRKLDYIERNVVPSEYENTYAQDVYQVENS